MKTNRAGSQFEWETLMKLRLFLLALLFSIAAGMALAHGTKVHLRIGGSEICLIDRFSVESQQ